MRRDTLKALYDIHSWTGLFLGLALYVLLFSGSVSLFVAELHPWQLGAQTTAGPPPIESLERAATHAVEAEPGLTAFTVVPSSVYRPWISVESGDDHGDGLRVDYFDPQTGAPVVAREDNAILVLERLHTDLLLPAPWGRYLTGLLAVAMLVSVLSGVFMHRKILREMWSIRLWRSTRLKWADLHKAVAVWGLPFHLMIAFTGAYLGLVGVTLSLNALIAFGGDIEAAATGIAGAAQQAAGEPAAMLSLAELLARAQTALPGLQPERLTYQNYGDLGATMMVLGRLPDTLEYYPGVVLNAVNGELLQTIHWRAETWPKALYAMMTPLHYASYGGLVLKVLYALLGMGASFLVISGLRIWQLRVHPPGADVRLPLIDGVCFGMPLAMALLLLATRLPDSLDLTGYEARLWLFLLTWLATIAYAYWRRHAQPARRLCLGTGVVLVLLPLWTLPAGHLPKADTVYGSAGSPVVVANVVLLLLGAAVLAGAWLTPRRSAAVNG